MGYVDGYSLTLFMGGAPVVLFDPFGLQSWRNGPVMPGLPPIGPWADGGGVVDDPPFSGTGPEVPTIQKPKTCGPDVTAWFDKEVELLKDEIGEQQDAGNAKWLLKSVKVAGLGLTAKYDPETTFALPGCPQSESCANTVTYASYCIHKSELGNLLAGYMLGLLGIEIGSPLYKWTTDFNRTNGGPISPWSEAGLDLGVWGGWSGGPLSDLAYHPAYEKYMKGMSGGADGGCTPCDKSIPEDAPHSDFDWFDSEPPPAVGLSKK